jgi:hypothetical protein
VPLVADLLGFARIRVHGLNGRGPKVGRSSRASLPTRKESPMSSGITVPVPSSEDYQAPESSRSRIAAKFARMPTVDQNGRIVRKAETGTTDVTGAAVNPSPPTMVEALGAAAARCGATLAELLDSNSFCAELGAISPSDAAGLDAAIRATMPPPATSGMKPVASQGASASGGVHRTTATTVADRIRAEAAKANQQPIPPGSIVR